MDVVVTGAGGYVGPVVIQTLLAADPAGRIIAVTRDPAACRARYGGESVGRVTAVTPEAFLAGSDPGGPVDAVIHLAAGGRSDNDPAAYAASLRLTRDLVAWCLSNRCPRFIFASSQAVYGTLPIPWHEATQPAPLSTHAIYKYAAEMLLDTLRMDASRRLQTVALRFAKLVGPSAGFRIGRSEWPHRLVDAVVSRQPVPLPAAGAQVLDLVDVRDAAAAVLAALTHGNRPLPPVINIGSGRPVTVREVADRVAAIGAAAGFPPLRVVLEPAGQAPLRSFAMATALAEQALGFQPRITLDQTIRDVFTLLAPHRRA